MPIPKGYVCLVLHAHLPFVRHPEEEHFFEENWLFEALTETYIPLLNTFQRLSDSKLDFRFTMSLTPSLVCMLQDPLLQQRYLRHLDSLIELAEKEVVRTRKQAGYHRLARLYRKHFIATKNNYLEQYNKNIVAAFRHFQKLGCLEIIASCATHGFLPNLRVNASSVEAQIRLGIASYQKTFGCEPKGFWLPECGYYPGLDDILKAAGIQYFFVDTHGLSHATPMPQYGVYAPIYCPSGVAAFGRDNVSSKQVWSAQEGYPGDADYREYYRDIGHELDYEYVKPYIHPMGSRVNTGIKYWRITGDTDQKKIYQPRNANNKVMSHAVHFIADRKQQIEYLARRMDRKPIVVAPYDAELFGHWWFEGPLWLENLARKIATEVSTIKLITPSEYLAEYPRNQITVPSSSSWGDKGYGAFWLENTNHWIYPHLHMAGKRMQELATRFAGNDAVQSPQSVLVKRALNQAARELMLAESSDWPFIMKTGTVVPYANRRVKSHINRFTHLYESVLNHTIDEAWLREIEWRDNIFSDMACVDYYG